MFLGHYALAFASKRAAPRASLGLLVAAGSLLDLVWPVLVLAGVETVRIDPGNTPFTPLDFVSYPFTHSLLFVCAWAALFGAGYFWWARDRAGAAVLAALVVSHWALDVISHRPDMPLYPGSVRIGLGLWYSVAGTVIVEGALFAAGVWLYVTATRPGSPGGRWALWALVALFVVAYLAVVEGPPPPSARAVAMTGLAAWLFPPWAAWIDHRRRVRDDA